MRVPVATYRVQFNQDFRFANATAIVPDLHRLGSLTCTRLRFSQRGPVSTHGYDVVDPNRLNPALGTEDDFETMVGALQQRGMGLLLDIVPNHMAASPENAWWMDVLENGPASPYATYFGINWRGARDRSRTRFSCRSSATRTGPCSIAGRFASRMSRPGSFFIISRTGCR